jgi:hypothetical protein
MTLYHAFYKKQAMNQQKRKLIRTDFLIDELNDNQGLRMEYEKFVLEVDQMQNKPIYNYL